MIDFDNPPTRVADYRGTIEVYDVRGLGWPYDSETPEWRWRCKSRNGQILASGEGYKRRAGALNAIDAQYGVRWAAGFSNYLGAELTSLPEPFEALFVVPWRVVIHDRNGNTTIGALY